MEVGGVLRAGGDEGAGAGSGPRRVGRTGKQARVGPALISTVLQVAVSAFVYVRSPLRTIPARPLEAQDAGHAGKAADGEDEDDSALFGGMAARVGLGPGLGV